MVIVVVVVMGVGGEFVGGVGSCGGDDIGSGDCCDDGGTGYFEGSGGSDGHSYSSSDGGIGSIIGIVDNIQKNPFMSDFV